MIERKSPRREHGRIEKNGREQARRERDGTEKSKESMKELKIIQREQTRKEQDGKSKEITRKN